MLPTLSSEREIYIKCTWCATRDNLERKRMRVLILARGDILKDVHHVKT